MDRVFILSMAIYAVWILLPLAPAIIIYKLFPNTQVALSGPFSSLTLNTAGAFAAYLVVVIASVYMLDTVRADVRHSVRSYWTLTADLEVYDGLVKLPDIDAGRISVAMNPQPVRFENGRLRMTIAREGDRWPDKLRVNVDGFGAQEFRFQQDGLIDREQNLNGWTVNADDQTIELANPIVIVRRQQPSALLARTLAPTTDATAQQAQIQ